MKHHETLTFRPGDETAVLSAPSEAEYTYAAELLRAGELVAFPTETVYGLGAMAINPSAVAKIYAAKGRPSDNPLIVHIARIEDITELVKEITPLAECLIRAFMPGPITLVMKKSAVIPDLVSAGLPTVGIRMPSHPVALRFLEKVGTGVAAPSANLSGSPSPTRAEHVYKDLAGRIPLILDGGPCDVGIESTVVDVTGTHPVILRPGAITGEMIQNACQSGGISGYDVSTYVMPKNAQNETPRAPGMKYRHYAPKAATRIVEGGAGRPERLLKTVTEELTRREGNIGVYCGTEESDYMKKQLAPTLLSRTVFYPFGTDSDIQKATHSLFGALRSLDAAEVGMIIAVGFEGDGLEGAYMNRLRKASSPNPDVSDAGDSVGDIVRSVLFVCTGNTCRSPMAMAIFASMTKSHGPYLLLPGKDRFARILSSSAGIFAETGSPPADAAVRAVKTLFDIDLSGHRSRKTTPETVTSSDLIFTATTEHATLLRRFFPEAAGKIYSFAEFFLHYSIPGSEESGTTDIGDPYGRSTEVYEKTAKQISRLLEDAWPFIMNELKIVDLSL